MEKSVIEIENEIREVHDELSELPQQLDLLRIDWKRRDLYDRLRFLGAELSWAKRKKK